MWSDYKVKTGNSSYLPIFWLTAKPVLSTCAGNNLYVRLRLGCIDFHHTVLCCGSFFCMKSDILGLCRMSRHYLQEALQLFPNKNKTLTEASRCKVSIFCRNPSPWDDKNTQGIVICRQDRQKSCVSLKEELLCSGDCQIKVTQWQNAMQHLGQ